MKKIWMGILVAMYAGALLAGNAFKPLIFRGKPFFPIGDWDVRNVRAVNFVHPLFEAAGANCVIFQIPLHDEAQLQRNLETIRFFRDNHPNIAVLAEIMEESVFLNHGDRKVNTALPKEQIPPVREKLIKVVKELRSYGNVLGYTFDEMENALYKGMIKEYKETKDVDADVSKYMEKAASWFIDVIHEYHPEAYYIPCQAWWSTYDKNGAVYDILMANEYPVTCDDISKCDYYTVALDAIRAAEATKKFNKRCFIYCPPGFNFCDGRWKKMRPYTQPELRYFWLSPVTCGSMGVMAWRFRRAKDDFARQVVIPTALEVKALVPWLLGEPVDADVKCPQDNEIAKYYIAKRNKMTDDEDSEREVRKVKKFTWIARRNPQDKSVLLLVANNSNKKAAISFEMSEKIDSVHGFEIFCHQELKIRDHKFNASVKPFEVRAFILFDRERSGSDVQQFLKK